MKNSFYSELANKIAQYFDQQLNKEDEIEFLSELKKHPASMEVFEKEKNIRGKLKENLYKSDRINRLSDQIKDQIKKYPGS